MHYHDGTPVKLGDRVRAAIPGGTAPARIVMLGDTYEHLEIDPQFLQLAAKRARVLAVSCILCLEWVEASRFRA